MKKVLYLVLIFALMLALTHCAPADNKDSPKESQSAFVPAFDEIVVESSLTVRRKNDAGRQGRNKNAPKSATTTKPTSSSISSSTTTSTRTKRQYSGFSGFSGFSRPGQIGFGGSVSDAHAQANNVHGPLGSFGSSSSSSQNQAFAVGPNGLTSSVGLSGTQHYYFPNGMKIDVNFANGGSALNGHRNSNSGAATSSVLLTDSAGRTRFYH